MAAALKGRPSAGIEEGAGAHTQDTHTTDERTSKLQTQDG